MTQLQLAKAAGISRSQLSEIENEAKPVNTKRLRALATAMNVSVEDLFDTDTSDSAEAVLRDLLSRMNADDRDAIIRLARTLAAKSP